MHRAYVSWCVSMFMCVDGRLCESVHVSASVCMSVCEYGNKRVTEIEKKRKRVRETEAEK